MRMVLSSSITLYPPEHMGGLGMNEDDSVLVNHVVSARIYRRIENECSEFAGSAAGHSPGLYGSCGMAGLPALYI